MCLELVLRFGYGAIVPWVFRLEDDRRCAIAGPDMVLLKSPVEVRGENLTTVAEFTVSEGETLPFALTYEQSHLPPPETIDPIAALEATERFWSEWSGRCKSAGPWSETVTRSMITLKALTYAPTGGIVAAPTTSLPEQIGGARNWDYRFCWLRDATLTLLAFMNAGYFDEAQAWRDWLVRAVAGSPSQAQILYGIAGERRMIEWQIAWLPGYEGSTPVRIGNQAHEQFQLDVYGEVLDAFYQARHGGLKRSDAAAALQLAFLDHLEEVWRQPDESIWEVRGPRRQFTYSKMMAWVAFDRAVKSFEAFGRGDPARADKWRHLRAEIHEDICRNAFDADLGSFVQSYGSTELDASLLLIPAVGFLPPDDPRVRGTVEAIEQRLLVDGFVLRYDTGTSDDGLPPGEGVFLACSFWLVDAYLLLGRHDDAHRLFERLIALCNDVGLLSEEFDPRLGRLVGNFPQAFSHVALANCAFNLSRQAKPVEQRANAGSETEAKKLADAAT